MSEVRLVGGCPYPHVATDGALQSGTVLEHPALCTGCVDRPCKLAHGDRSRLSELSAEIFGGTCGRGVDYVRVELSGGHTVLNGLAVTGAGLDRPRRQKKELASNRVSINQLRDWQQNQNEASHVLEADLEEKVRQSLEMFHDVQTAASTIIRSAERLQAKQVGATDDERFERLPADAQTLVKAAGLLELRMQSMPIVSNPAAASYGFRRRRSIYRIVDRTVRTLQPLGEDRKIALRLDGPSHASVSVFESFDLLPLTLIENAIKYSATDRVVEIVVRDTVTGVSVSVSSFSPWIPPEERQSIFQKRFRGSTASRVAQKGSGLGLFIAEAVAQAHATHIRLDSDDTDERSSGIRYCNNRFFFNIH